MTTTHIYILLLILASAFLLFTGICIYFILYGLTRKRVLFGRKQARRQYTRDVPLSHTIAKNKQNEDVEVAEYLKEHPLEEYMLSADDGISLRAYALKARENTSTWVIVVHGYKQDYQRMLGPGIVYAQNDFNVLLPDNRAHGTSDGTLIGMGYLDSYDLLSWVQWLKEEKQASKILLHGESMGGCTVLNVAGKNPNDVFAYISDSSFTAPLEIFEEKFTGPAFLAKPVVFFSNFLLKTFLGKDYRKGSAVKSLQYAKNPILFIHGDKDTFVPLAMGITLYNAYSGPKEIYIAKGASHQQARWVDPEKYWDVVYRYIRETADL